MKKPLKAVIARWRDGHTGDRQAAGCASGRTRASTATRLSPDLSAHALRPPPPPPLPHPPFLACARRCSRSIRRRLLLGPAYATQSPPPMASRPPPRTSFVRRRPFLAFGLPFMTLIAGSSFFLERFTRTRYAEMNRFAWVSQRGRLMFVPPPPALASFVVARRRRRRPPSPMTHGSSYELRDSQKSYVRGPSSSHDPTRSTLIFVYQMSTTELEKLEDNQVDPTTADVRELYFVRRSSSHSPLGSLGLTLWSFSLSLSLSLSLPFSRRN